MRTALPTSSRFRIGVRGVRIAVIACLQLLALSLVAVAEDGIAKAKPESVGMSTERLLRIHEVLQRHIDEGHITGAVTAVARHGKLVHFEAHGLADVEAGTPMPEDAIFRMASSSKPVAGVAVLMLMEEGKLRLTDPVHRFIPEFKDMKVAVPKGGGPEPRGPWGRGRPAPEVDLVPADRDITILDLLTHTSGLLSGGLGSAVSDVQRQSGDTLADYIPRLGAVPLDFQPGTRWAYSAGAGIDTLGRIVEIVSGQTFDVFLRERIFEPLGMVDTFFNLPEDRQSRLLPLYRGSDSGWQKRPSPAFLNTRTYFSGAGGLMSTAHDYLMFEQMLVNGGELNGHRLLSPRTVKLMGSNHVDDLYHGLTGTDQGRGFGLTVRVVLDDVKAMSGRSIGAFGWGGAFGTMSWTDPEEGIAAVIMLQQRDGVVQTDFAYAVRQAIIE